MTTKIEWADMTINPIVGCSHCSPGCDNCKAERIAARLAKHPNPKISGKYAGVVDENGKWTGSTNFDYRALAKIPSTKRGLFANQPGAAPKRIFIGSMCDLFHPTVSDDSINAIFYAIAHNPEHTFMLLTKRASQMKNRMDFFTGIVGEKLWPLPNLWLGVTVCNQAEADEKIALLLQTPATVRFVSIEPMLGPVDLTQYLDMEERHYRGDVTSGFSDYEPLLHWIICGGETGPGVRPMHPDWVRSLHDQCESAGVPFFFKSWGEWSEDVDPGEWEYEPSSHTFQQGGRKTTVYLVGKRRSGRLLDGREWCQVPKVKA